MQAPNHCETQFLHTKNEKHVCSPPPTPNEHRSAFSSTAVQLLYRGESAEKAQRGEHHNERMDATTDAPAFDVRYACGAKSKKIKTRRRETTPPRPVTPLPAFATGLLSDGRKMM